MQPKLTLPRPSRPFGSARGDVYALGPSDPAILAPHASPGTACDAATSSGLRLRPESEIRRRPSLNDASAFSMLGRRTRPVSDPRRPPAEKRRPPAAAAAAPAPAGGPFETLEAQCGPGRANESAPCYNRALASLQRTHESAAAAVNRDAGGARWTVLNLQGAMQAAGAVAGTSIGRPDMSQFTPTRFYEPDCLHPNERGLRILTHAIVQRYFVCPEGPPCVHDRDPTRRKKGGRRRR